MTKKSYSTYDPLDEIIENFSRILNKQALWPVILFVPTSSHISVSMLLHHCYISTAFVRSDLHELKGTDTAYIGSQIEPLPEMLNDNNPVQ